MPIAVKIIMGAIIFCCIASHVFKYLIALLDYKRYKADLKKGYPRAWYERRSKPKFFKF